MESEEQPEAQGANRPDDRGTAARPDSGVDGGPAPVATPPPPTGVPVTRAGRLWMALLPALIFLVVLLVFIFQNLHNVKISFFTASGSFPLALALLLAAVGGALIVLCLGSIRILQLRRTVRRRSRLASPPGNQQA
ncbi:MAG: lipopolysaccharide assembly protein LapA domain-containing protein [Acidimicrobiales bacterium]|jgi:uncharacterized integral membrane protein